MVQFCCGVCDCGAAGLPNYPQCSAKFGGGGGSSGALRLKRNGTLITPAYEGPAEPVAETEITPRMGDNPFLRAPVGLATREDEKPKGVCAGDWKPGPNDGDDMYIRPADGGTIVKVEVEGAEGGTEYQITRSRTQSWSTTVEMSLGIADVLSLGLSFSSTFEESITDSGTASFTVPEGETGYIIFTAYLMCSVGSGTCRGEKIEGEFCTPYRQTNGEMAGEYSVVING
ncbi:uncharacterized protein PG986_008567 [Apiospora aurea]|uniref:Uncharacterized protein n=1 Tax=Apiospora aurea TaxID=335848 RepID=A0ABR1QFV1_9PEZI